MLETRIEARRKSAREHVKAKESHVVQVAQQLIVIQANLAH